ncbi:MAG: glycosyltransferase family 39 protein [Candidatus Hydrogenedentales bacterium]|jgi:hypothetical protein
MRVIRSLTGERLMVYGLFHIPMTILFVLGMWASMSWMSICDGPIFMYSGFLMDHYHMVPVRDFFTYNMIGTHVIFRLLYHVFGGSVMGIRLADAAVLLTIMALMMRMLAPFGHRVAWAGAVLFGSFQFFHWEHCTLEREYLGLVPLALAVLFATTWCADRMRLRWFMTGLFCGVLITLKPHLVIGCLALFGYFLLDRDSTERLRPAQWIGRSLRIACWCCLGGSLPVLWMAGYCLYYGILGEFLRVIIAFFPLHANISGQNEVFNPGERIPYLIYTFFSWRPWGGILLAVGTIAGLALFLLSPTVTQRERKLGYLFLGLQATYLIYPVFGSRFYDYHYYPFWFFCCAWVAFCLRKWPNETPLRFKAFALLLSAYVIGGLFYNNYDEIKHTPHELLEPAARTQRMATWVSRRLQPGDTVQPIEWGFCGTIHATLKTGAKVPTRIVWGEGLFHHVSNPFIQELRKNFVDELAASKPRFILQSKMNSDFIKGNDCSKIFPALEELLNRDYFIALDSQEFAIWESNASPTADDDRARRKKDLEMRLREDDSRGDGEDLAPVFIRTN